MATVAAQSAQHQQGSGDGAGSGTTGNQVVTRGDGSGSGTGGGSGATAAGGPPEGSGTTAEQGNAGGSGSGSKDGERPSQGAKQKSGRSTESSSDSDSSNDRGGNNTRRAPARYVHEFYAMDGARTRLRVHRVIITPTNGQVAPGAGWHIFTALLSEGFYILLPFGRTERFAPESNQADWSFLLGSLRHRRLHDLEIPGWQGFNRQSGVVVSEAARTCLPVLWQGKLQPLLYVPTPDLVPQAEAGSSHAGRNDNTANVSYTAQATRAQAAGATTHTAQMALDTADLTAAAAYAARDMLRAAQPRPDIVSVHIAPLPGPTLLSPQRNGDSANAGATQHVRGLIRTLLLADRILHDENRYLAGRCHIVLRTVLSISQSPIKPSWSQFSHNVSQTTQNDTHSCQAGFRSSATLVHKRTTACASSLLMIGTTPALSTASRCADSRTCLFALRYKRPRGTENQAHCTCTLHQRTGSIATGERNLPTFATRFSTPCAKSHTRQVRTCSRRPEVQVTASPCCSAPSPRTARK